MKNFRLAAGLASALLFLPLTTGCDRSTPTQAVVRQVCSSSVCVITDHGQGSGVIFHKFGKTYVLTAAHVLGDAPYHSVVKVTQGKRDWSATVVNIDAERDLALVRLEAKYKIGLRATLAPADAAFPIGTPLLHVGNVLGYRESYMEGTLSAAGRLEDGTFWQSSIVAYPGSSGGGIFTADGVLIGILTRGVGPGINFFLPPSFIHEWAEDNDLQWLFE